MMVPIHALPIDGCWAYCPSVHRECRGDISTLYGPAHAGCPPFVEDKGSRSYRGVLRGFHGDFRTAKLLGCLHGEVMLAIADARRTSPTFGQSHHMVLSDRDRMQVFIPSGVLNAHYCLSEECLFWYKLSAPYAGQDAQHSVRWDDPDLNVPWPSRYPVLSGRDRAAPAFADVDWPDDHVRRITVAVSGYFNPLHGGHLDMIAEAQAMGDSLVVIVNNDHQVALKDSKPFMSQEERLRVVTSLKGVDRAVLSVDRDRSVSETLALVRPDIFANGGDVASADHVREADTCAALGIEMRFGVGGGKTQSSSWLLGGRADG